MNTKVTKESLDIITLVGVTEQLQKDMFLQHFECQLGDQRITYNFLCIPYCSIPLVAKTYFANCTHNNSFSLKAATVYRDPAGTGKSQR